jgi:hypothetical protein
VDQRIEQGSMGQDSLYQEKLKKAFWNGNQLMIDYVELKLEGNLGT